MLSDSDDDFKPSVRLLKPSMVPEDELSPEKVITSPVDPLLMPTEAAAVAKAAIDDHVARRIISPDEIYEMTVKRIEYYKATAGKTVESRKDISKVLDFL